jgi:hypothetical protein
MAKDDDILMGDPVALTTDSDSDGDGVGDMQERLEGTDPNDASDHLKRDPALKPEDPRADLDPATLEREVAFDPTALMPEGMSVDSGLKGLKNLDGSDLPTGSNRYGVGEDAILDGRLGANSPRDVQRNPLAGTGSDSGPKGGAPPVDLGSRGPNWDLVGADPEDDWELPVKPHETPTLMSDPPSPPPEGERQPPTPPPDDGSDPLPEPEPDPGPLRTDPDSDIGGGGGTPLVVIAGPRVVEGYGGGPQIEGDSPPVRYGDLVTDGGDGSVDTSTTTEPLRGAPDAPVVHTINPDLGLDRPPTSDPAPSGGGGGDDVGVFGGSDAATAASADVTGEPGISLAGAGGGGGIASAAPSAPTSDAVSGIRDPSVRPLTDMELGEAQRAPDAGATAVDKFATEYLEDASLDAAAPDFAATGLAVDLGGDPAAEVKEFESPVLDDPGAESRDDLATLDRDDSFDG